MSKNNIASIKEADSLYINIKELVNQSKNNIYRVVNTEMLFLYWNIGKMIVEKQGGNERAKYGDYIISSLSTKLVLEFGNGYSIQNLKRMRKFYLCFPISSTVSSQLCWSHYTELIKIDNENERNYYMYECIKER